MLMESLTDEYYDLSRGVDLREAHHMQWSACIYELWTRR